MHVKITNEQITYANQICTQVQFHVIGTRGYTFFGTVEGIKAVKDSIGS